MKKVITLEKPDVEGKLIDRIELSKTAFMIGFDADEQDSLDEIKLACLRALFKLSQSKNKRVRLRDFVILSGTATNRLGINLLAICFPKGISSRVAYPFYEQVKKFHPTDTGTYPIEDFTIDPLARYTDGRIIIYTSFSSPKVWLPSHFKAVTSWGADWETRSAELTSPPEKIKFSHLPKAKLPQKPDGERHSLKDHNRLGEALDDILQLKGTIFDDPDHMVPFGYSRLRWFCQRHLGIQVREKSLGSASGRIRVGRPFLLEAETCASVFIEINPNLAESTKYVALAHELAHYRLHFPWLMLINLAYYQALAIPETAILLENFLRKKGDILQRIEDQADLYSSYFLIPPMTNLIRLMAGFSFTAGQELLPEELVWKYLGPFFPAHDLGRFAWSEDEERSKQALESLIKVTAGVPPETLLNRYYAALIKRLNSKTHDLMGQEDSYELLRLLSFSSGPNTDIQTDVRKLVDRKVMLGEWQRPSTSEEFLTSFLKMTQAQLGPEAQISLTKPQQPGGRESHCQVSVFLPEGSETANLEKSLWVPLPGLSEEMAVTRQEWVCRLPNHGLYFASVSERTREFLIADSADERHLVIIPTSWNLEMKADQDWYAIGVRQKNKWLEEADQFVVGTKNEWAVLCAKKGLGLTTIRPLKRQLKQLRQLELSHPFLVDEILQTIKSVNEIDLLLERVNSGDILEIPAWKKEDYFEKDRKEHDYFFSSSDRTQGASTGPNRYAYRIMQDLVFDEYSGVDFWEMMFLAKKILRHHSIPSEEERETLKIIRELVVDCHLGGDLNQDFKCKVCGKDFPAVLEQDFVAEVLAKEKIICVSCKKGKSSEENESFIQ